MKPTNILNTNLKKRILDISYQLKLSHIQSCLTAVDIIQEIYETKTKDDPFILSSGHAALAWYVVLEGLGGKDAAQVFAEHGVHPDRCAACNLTCSSGSLGHGLGIGTGMALADAHRQVYVLTTDGEWAEGSMYESLAVIDRYHVDNLHVFVNCNGFGGYSAVALSVLERRLRLYEADIRYFKTDVDYLNVDALRGLNGHYQVLDDAMYQKAMKSLS